jgi:hypothetical protein
MNIRAPSLSRCGPAKRRPLGNLRLLDIGDDRSCGRNFGARETAKPVERAEVVKPL